MIKHLKKKWGIQSNLHFWWIFSIFGITGTSMLFIKPPLFSFLGIDSTIPAFQYALLYILIITPVYFFTLLIIGSILGQFNFFWNFEKKTFKGIASIFKSKK